MPVRHVFGDAFTDLPLPVGELKRQFRVKLGQQTVSRAGPGNCRQHCGFVSSLRQDYLQHQRLVVGQPPACSANLREVFWRVDGVQRGVIRQQGAVADDLGWHRIRQRVQHLQCHLDCFRNPGAIHRRGRGIDRNQLFGEDLSCLAIIRVVGEVAARVHHLQPPPILAHFSGEQSPATRPQIARPPDLIEEGEGQSFPAVSHGRFDAATPPTPAAGDGATVLYFRDDGGLLPRNQVGEVGQFTPTFVTPRVMLQQVAYCLDLQVFR